MTSIWTKVGVRTTLAFALACIVVCPRPGMAQIIRGGVRDSLSGTPIAGAVVQVLDSAGVSRVRTLTDRNGRYAVRAFPSQERLQVLHIGHIPREVRLPTFGANDTVAVNVAMARVAFRLDAMQTTAPRANGCPSPPDGGAGFALWEQARAEFLAAVVARDAAAGAIQVLWYERDIDAKTGRVTRQQTNLMSGLASNTSVASRSAQRFADQGYVDATPASSMFYGPDADVLLADAFINTHCFQVTQASKDRPTNIGVAFAPAVDKWQFADIAGVLWIDSSAHSVTSLDYAYVGMTSVTDGALGGRMTFRLLSNGVPFIEHWIIRSSPFAWAPDPLVRRAPHAVTMPDLVKDNRGSGGVLATAVGGVATGETGAELLDGLWPDSTRWHAALGTIGGTVRPRRPDIPVVPLRVRLVGTEYAADVDSAGRFALTTVLPGRYTIVAEDPMLQSFLQTSQARDTAIDVARDSVVRVDLAIERSRDDVVGAFCGGKPRTGTRTELLARQAKSDLLLRLVTSDSSALQRNYKPQALSTLLGVFAPAAVTRANESGTWIACAVSWESDVEIRLPTKKDKDGRPIYGVDIHHVVPTGATLDTLTIHVPPDTAGGQP